MKKQILLISMMLAIAGVYAQGVDFTVNKALKKDYFKVQISITSGVAPFDITFNGRHLDQYSLFAQYDVPNIITITDANNNTKTDTIFETDPHFSWGIGYFSSEFTGAVSGASYKKTGISIRCSFRDRYNFEIKWYRTSDYAQIGFAVDYEPVPDSIWTCLVYQVDQAPIGIYAVSIRDTVHYMDTLVFVEITSSVDTTTTDTTTTDTTQHLKININEKVDGVEFYPNPTNDFCNTSEMLREVCIFSSKGDLVRVYKNTNRISLAGLSAGSYLIRYTTLDGKTTNSKKIIKK
ncbi:MAG: T9SS type A sorting domain-containing protein [Bacteroidales bacterium]|nr:T9SS type A sorting domain-containing protein [Bacteroidales bacterium]